MPNNTKRCRYCKQKHLESEMVRVQMSWFCNYDHATKFALDKLEQKKEKEIKAKVKELKVKNKTLSQLKKEAEYYVNAYVRIRDEGKPCCSCSKPHQSGDQAGHFIAVGSCDELRFNTKNIHSQCIECNLYQSGNLLGYRDYMVKRYGEQLVNDFQDLARSKRINKWDRDYLIRLKDVFKRRCTHLKKIKNNQQKS